MSHTRAIISMGTWNEETYHEGPDQRKMTRVAATFGYTGAIEGASQLAYLMVYTGENTGHFLGLERIEGQVAGKAGSFVRQHAGTFDPTTVTTRWVIFEGTGTGELAGLTGHGEYVMTDHGPYDTAFDYEFVNE